LTDIWTPDLGTVPISAVSASNAVSDYDPDLMLGRFENTGEWAVFIKNGPHGGPFPVFHLGRELPPYDLIQKKLYESDVRRHGHKLVETIQRRNDARTKALDDAAHEAAEETAEAIEWGFRKFGKHPNPRIFVPGDK